MTTTSSTSYEDRVLGCLLGTAAGDAFGVLHSAGDDPRAAFTDPASAVVTDATQLTLSTVDALTEALEWANDGIAADEIACVWLAYLRWLTRQGEHLPSNLPVQPGRWLDRQEDLLPVHHPDEDTVRALMTGEMGTRVRPLNPLAEGPGALMRSAPFGLVPRIPDSMVERLTVDAAALTHGSAAAKGAAARYSSLIRSLVVEHRDLAAALEGDREVEQRLAAAAHDADARPRRAGHPNGVAVGAGGEDPALVGATHEDAPRTASGSMAVGAPGSTTADATLDAALQAVAETAHAASPKDHLDAALAHAAAAGRPDASGGVAASLAGGIIGALHGTAALPPAYLSAEGLTGVVRTMGQSLIAATTGS